MVRKDRAGALYDTITCTDLLSVTMLKWAGDESLYCSVAVCPFGLIDWCQTWKLCISETFCYFDFALSDLSITILLQFFLPLASATGIQSLNWVLCVGGNLCV